MTTIINLYGGPGIGKSTLAAKVFAAMKDAGCNVELVSEYVKQWAWEERIPVDYDQFYFFGHQTKREHRLFGKVDFIVTDSPVMLVSYYAQIFGTPHQGVLFRSMYLTYLDMCSNKGHKHEHYLLKRCHPYQNEGRFHSEEEAYKIDEQLERFMKEHGLQYKQLDANDTAVSKILLDVGVIKESKVKRNLKKK